MLGDANQAQRALSTSLLSDYCKTTGSLNWMNSVLEEDSK